MFYSPGKVLGHCSPCILINLTHTVLFAKVLQKKIKTPSKRKANIKQYHSTKSARSQYPT